MTTRTQTKTKPINPNSHWIVVNKGTKAKQFITFGKQKGWDVAVLGIAPMPKEPFHKGDWLIIPAHMDKSIIPSRARQRVQAIRNAGFQPKGYVLVHEIPKSLPAVMPKIPKVQVPTTSSPAKPIGGIFRTLGVAIGTIFAMILLIDPILVVVTVDNHWIEIDRWWD